MICKRVANIDKKMSAALMSKNSIHMKNPDILQEYVKYRDIYFFVMSFTALFLSASISVFVLFTNGGALVT